MPLNGLFSCWKLLAGDGRANGRRFRLEMLSKTKGAFTNVHHPFTLTDRVLCGSEYVHVGCDKHSVWTVDVVIPENRSS